MLVVSVVSMELILYILLLELFIERIAWVAKHL